MKSAIAIIVVAILALFVLPELLIKNNNSDQPEIEIARKTLSLRIADSLATRNQGLSGTLDLPKDEAMLFIFSAPGRPSFWMKSMLISIDIIWINEKLQIVQIDKNVSPSTFPKTFSPDNDIIYVLETNAGFANENKIRAGDYVKLSL